MKLLLDTCSFLWLATGDARLSKVALDLYWADGNDVFVSAVSCFEIALKHRAGKLALPSQPEDFVASAREQYGLEALPVDEASALHTARLPELHKDPFDRLLVAQAIVHGMVLLTPDQAVRAYPARTLW